MARGRGEEDREIAPGGQVNSDTKNDAHCKVLIVCHSSLLRADSGMEETSSLRLQHVNVKCSSRSLFLGVTGPLTVGIKTTKSIKNTAFLRIDKSQAISNLSRLSHNIKHLC